MQVSNLPKALLLAAMFVAGTQSAVANAASSSGSYQIKMIGQVEPQASAGPQVFLLKGLADIFSTGMDTLAARLRQRGIPARVANHGAAYSFADEVARNYKAGARGSVIIIGHSFGADAAVEMADRLNAAKVPVALVVTFGPGASVKVPANVARAVNYYLTSGLWRGRLLPGPGFKGSISNVNLDNSPDVSHFNIEKIDRLQADTVNAIAAAVGKRKAN